MAQFTLYTFGIFRIENIDQETYDLVSKPVRCALFTYLALNRSASRDELMSILWPDRSSGRARHSLNQTLYELRRQFDSEIFRSHGDKVAITDRVTVDAHHFLHELKAGNFEQAYHLYKGTFLKGLHLGISNEFESWADRTRFEFERHFRDVCRKLIQVKLDQNDENGAYSIVQRWVSIDPLEDEAQHLLIKLLAQMGRRSEAIQQYDRYKELILHELDVEPLDETKELIRKIREDKSISPSLSLIADNAANPTDFDRKPADQNYLSGEINDVHLQNNRSRYAGRYQAFLLAGFVIIFITGLLYYLNNNASPPESIGDMRPEPYGIAVLPFVNMSADPDQEYFADGITEDLLTSLTKLDRMRVISRTSVMRYKESDLSLSDIARELNVAYVLEGSVRRDLNHVRVTAQLIEVANDNHLWAETFDRELTEIFNLKSDIAHQIAEALEHRLLPDDLERIAYGGTENLTAYDYLLRGREYLNRPGEADKGKYYLAKQFFRQALEADPNFARAYAGISEIYRRNVLLPVTARRDSMLLYAGKAVELDPGLAEAAAELGFAYLFAWEHYRSENEFRRALELDPNQTDAMTGLARLSVLNGNFARAIHWERLAVSSDPLSAERLYNLGYYLFNLGDLDGAQTLFERVVRLVPDHPSVNLLLSYIHLIRGENELAEERMRNLESIASNTPTVQIILASYYAQIGQFDIAEDYLNSTEASQFGATGVLFAFVAQQLGQHHLVSELLKQPEEMLAEWESSGFSVPPLGKFYIHLIRGNIDSAFSVLDENWRSGMMWIEDPPEMSIYWLDQKPVVEPLLDKPEFQELLIQLRVTFDEIRDIL